MGPLSTAIEIGHAIANYVMRELSSVVIKYLPLRRKDSAWPFWWFISERIWRISKKFRVGEYAYTNTGVYMYRAAGQPDDLFLFGGA
jgi:hypothetical protein